MTTQDVEVVSEVILVTGDIVPSGQTGRLEVSETRWNFSWNHDGTMLSIQGDNTSLERSKDNESFWCNAKLGNGQVIQLAAQQDANASQSVESVKVEPPVRTEERVDEEAMAEPRSPLGSAERMNLVVRAAELRRQGILTDEEFQIEKSRILGTPQQTIKYINPVASASDPVDTAAPAAPPSPTVSSLAESSPAGSSLDEQATPMPARLAAKEIVSPRKTSPSGPSQDTRAALSPESTPTPVTSVDERRNSATVSKSRSSRSGALCMVGAACIVGGAFLPYYAASVSGRSQSDNAFQIPSQINGHIFFLDGVMLSIAAGALTIIALRLWSNARQGVRTFEIVVATLFIVPPVVHVWQHRVVFSDGTAGPGVGWFFSVAGAATSILAAVLVGRTRSYRRRYPPLDDSPSLQTVSTSQLKVLGTFSVAASGLALVGGFLPYITANAIIIQVSRNAFQLGKYESMDYNGYFLLAATAVLALVGMEALGVFGLRRFRRWLAILSILALAVPIVDAWTANDGGGAHFSVGIGSIVSCVGGVAAIVAVAMSFRKSA